MDLTKFLGQDSQEQSAQRLSKEEYAAQKKQEREEIWGMIDGKAQEVFQNGDSLKGFLDFMGQCKPQRTDNLFLLYAQNPEIRQVKTFEKWKEEGKVVKTGSKGYNFIVGQEYEKDGVIQQGYSIQKAYDISQIRTKQPEEAEPKPMDQLMEALLTDSEVRIQIADNLPDKVQAQYIPNKRTIYVRNGMSENATFHSISRELACASLDHHDGSYSRAGVSAQAYCAAYVTAQKYGVDVSGFSFDKVCQMQAFGQKDPKELRSFIQDVKSAAYSIGKQVDRNLGKSEQEFMTDEFAIPEEKTEKPAKSKKGFSGSFAVAFREEVWYVVVEKKEEKRRLAYDKNAICKDGPDHEPHADPCTPGSVPAGKRTGASGGYHTGSGSEAGRAGRGKALPDRSRTQQIRGSLKPAPGHIPEKRTLFRWDRQRPVKDHEIQIPPIPWKGKMKKGCGTNIQKYDTRKNRSHAEKISAGNRGHA